MNKPFYPQPKRKVTESKRVKPTQKQMGDISPSVDAELRERSHGLCELCGAAYATERAHLTGRKHLTWKTKVSDLVHLCTACHDWLDETPEGRRACRMMATVMNYELRRIQSG